MYVSCQLFLGTPPKNLKFQHKIVAAADKKNKYIKKHNRTEVLSTDIHGKKNMFINDVEAMLLQSERVSEMHFSAIWTSEFQFF